MLRRVSQTRSALSCSVATRSLKIVPSYNSRSTGVHDHAPRDAEDFLYEGEHQVIPGAHPLPLRQPNNLITRPVVSPYAPSPQRVHPYFVEPLPELPHFDATVPIVYTYGTIKENIIVPVYDTQSGGVSQTGSVCVWSVPLNGNFASQHDVLAGTLPAVFEHVGF
jgi:hypothetical protein